jgi:hypothetical protein
VTNRTKRSLQDETDAAGRSIGQVRACPWRAMGNQFAMTRWFPLAPRMAMVYNCRNSRGWWSRRNAEADLAGNPQAKTCSACLPPGTGTRRCMSVPRQHACRPCLCDTDDRMTLLVTPALQGHTSILRSLDDFLVIPDVRR